MNVFNDPDGGAARQLIADTLGHHRRVDGECRCGDQPGHLLLGEHQADEASIDVVQLHLLNPTTNGISRIETRARCQDDGHPVGCVHPYGYGHGRPGSVCHCGRIVRPGALPVVAVATTRRRRCRAVGGRWRARCVRLRGGERVTAPTTYCGGDVTVHHGDSLDVLPTLPAASFDAVVCDPPYGIRFMGRAWDGADIEATTRRGRETSPMPEGVGGPQGGYRSRAAEAGRYDLSANAAFGEWCEAWATECLRVLKPGGYLLAFGSPRTYHRLGVGVEDAGFEVRECKLWLHGQGFPKSLDVGDGRGTSLKPAYEPIVQGRKPFAGTVADNVARYGTGALNIDACRTEHCEPPGAPAVGAGGARSGGIMGQHSAASPRVRETTAAAQAGRWPTNVLLDQDSAAELDRQTGTLTSGTMRAGTERQARVGGTIYGADARTFVPADTYGDSGGASRFFPTFRYEAKAPTSERPVVDGVAHPTVKPLELMRWLVRLVTPPGGIVLDPFGGTGTTGQAAVLEHRRAVLIERETDYLPLIAARLNRPMAVGFDFGEEIANA